MISRVAQAIYNLYGDISREFSTLALYISERENFFANPYIPLEDKIRVLDESVAPIIKMILNNKLVRDIIKISEALSKISYVERGIKRVVVTSTVKDSESRLKSILEKRLNSEVTITEEIDKNLIGGLVIKYDDYLIDLSLKKSLEEIRDKI